MVFQERLPIPIEETFSYQEPVQEITGRKIREKEINKKEETDNLCSQMWTIYFDGSKSQEGSGAGCILIDAKGKHHFLSVR